MTRRSRRRYPPHNNDAWDRFITDWSQGPDGQFSFARMVELFAQLDCPDDFIPTEGTNGTKRMTAGINLRNFFADGVLRFRTGATIKLDLDEEAI